MKKLENVTLFGLDCVDIDRLIKVAKICQKDFEFGDIKLLTSINNDNDNTVIIDPIQSIEEYSRFMIESLNDYIDTEFVLVIQYDGFILNPDGWDDNFLNYDYIGAPWYIKEHSFKIPKDHNKQFLVGNGGFSLRSKKLLEVLQNDEVIKKLKEEPEDTFICVDNRQYLESVGIKFAPIDLAKRFSLEANEYDGVEWINQFGFHGLRYTDISKWLEFNPGNEIKNELDSWSLSIKEKQNINSA